MLKVASIDSQGNIIADTYDYLVFYKDQNYFRFKIFPDPLSSGKQSDRIFSNMVDNLNFQYFNAAIPPVEVVPTSATKVRITLRFETTTATSEANLRND